MNKCALRFPIAAVCSVMLLAACSSTATKNAPPPTPPAPTNTGSLYPFAQTQAHVKRMEQRRNETLQAAQLYKKAHKRLLSGDYADASTEFDTLMSRFPFSRYATQAQLEQIYAKYRGSHPDEALEDANRFLQQHPRHPHADYVLYLEGLINAGRNASITRFLGMNQSDHDPTYLQAAFQDFALLARRYPKSPYLADARQRMIALRDEISAHELRTAQFYMSRDAWVAAARRAEDIIANYPGAPATAHALLMMKTCYTKLKLQAQVQQVDALIAKNQASLAAAGLAQKDSARAAAKTVDPASVPLPPQTATDSRRALPAAA
ncbi:MAG TPA: outer membrane protein assembly factor BamD [Nevskiaceae bacterium]|nr:outer membrane protein assembly factor BamD [Nevskiaceae bacterium]